MKGMILPADAASMEANGKVSLLGGFWTSVAEGTVKMDAIVSVRVLPSEMGRHQVRMTLEKLQEDADETVLAIDGELGFEVSDGGLPQVGIAATQVLKLPPVNLGAGLYALRLSVDAELLDEWPLVVTARAEELAAPPADPATGV